MAVQRILAANMPGAVPALVVDDEQNVGVFGLGLDGSHKHRVDEQGIIHIAVFAHIGVGRSFGNGQTAAPFEARSPRMAQALRVGFPSHAAQLFVNPHACLGLGQFRSLFDVISKHFRTMSHPQGNRESCRDTTPGEYRIATPRCPQDFTQNARLWQCRWGVSTSRIGFIAVEEACGQLMYFVTVLPRREPCEPHVSKARYARRSALSAG